MIKAVIFDIDGVLIDSYEANYVFFQNLMKKAGYEPFSREEYPNIFHLTLWDAIKHLTKLKSDTEIERIWKLGKTPEVIYPLDLINVPEDAEKIVKELGKKYLLGIVTSRLKKSVYEAPHLKKLKKYFKHVIAYEDTKNHKPHPEPLLLACKKLGINTEETVYIGDTQHDMVAGKKAGTKTIFYSKNKINIADYCISSFKELPNIINKL
jgi:pyrophosphatase PpaX